MTFPSSMRSQRRTLARAILRAGSIGSLVMAPGDGYRLARRDALISRRGSSATDVSGGAER